MSEAGGAQTAPGAATRESSRRRVKPEIGVAELFTLFLTVGAISFGGGVVAYLREFVVRGRKWMNDDEFLDALEIGQTTPGLIAVNMSVIIGDRMRGALGAAAAALGILLPGTVVVMTLGVLYEANRPNPNVNHFLKGVAAAAVGLLFAVALQLGHRQLVHLRDLLIVIATFVSISFLNLSLVWVLLVMAPIAVLAYHPRAYKHRIIRPVKSREPTEITHS